MSPTEQQAEKRTRVKLDDELKIQLAIDRFGPQLVDLETLARRYNRAESVVSRAISSAFAEGLVEVRRVDRRTAPLRRPDLEDALLKRFPLLRRAIVIETDKIDDHAVQEKLGTGLAFYLHDRVWTDRERVVLGGGRSVHHAADCLTQFPNRLRPREVTVISACGDCYPNHLERNVWLDADANASLLARAFEDIVQVRLTSKHILLRAEDQDVRWKTDYAEKSFGITGPPTLGIFGVGAFDAQHRLARLTSDSTAQALLPPWEFVSGLIGKLKDLLELSQSITKDKKHDAPVVGEVGMSLFCSAGDVPGKLRALVDEINTHLFAPTMEQLARIGSIILIGGGETKAPVFRRILDWDIGGHKDPRPAFHMICTNEQTARLLLP